MIHDVSRSPPRLAAIAGVAVARSVWSTAAMNMGRNTATKRLRNCARVTRAGTADASETFAPVSGEFARRGDSTTKSRFFLMSCADYRTGARGNDSIRINAFVL